MNEFNTYILTQDFRSPMIGSSPIQFKAFKAGNEVVARLIKNLETPVVITKEGYQIPAKMVNVKPVATVPETDKSVIEENIEKIEDIKNMSFANEVKKASSTVVNAAFVGGGIGFLYAALAGKSRFGYVAAGLVAGAIVGGVIQKRNSVKKQL